MQPASHLSQRDLINRLQQFMIVAWKLKLSLSEYGWRDLLAATCFNITACHGVWERKKSRMNLPSVKQKKFRRLIKMLFTQCLNAFGLDQRHFSEEQHWKAINMFRSWIKSNFSYFRSEKVWSRKCNRCRVTVQNVVNWHRVVWFSERIMCN